MTESEKDQETKRLPMRAMPDRDVKRARIAPSDGQRYVAAGRAPFFNDRPGWIPKNGFGKGFNRMSPNLAFLRRANVHIFDSNAFDDGVRYPSSSD
jgi:hypothetical protein